MVGKQKVQTKSLDEKLVRQVAQLAQIKLSEEEVKKFSVQLGDILTYVEKLNEVNTAGVEMTSQVTGLTNRLRKDDSKVSLSIEEVLKNTFRKKDSYFVVPSPLKLKSKKKK